MLLVDNLDTKEVGSNMNNIVRYDDFINEELRPETYISAADKLDKKGHRKRANNLRDYVKELSKNIEPVTVELYGKTYVMGADNIIVEENPKMNWVIMEIWIDPSTNVQFDENNPDLYEPMAYYLNYDKKNDDINYDGLCLDRKSSVKILKLVKEYARTMENKKFAAKIMELTVNDLYED